MSLVYHTLVKVILYAHSTLILVIIEYLIGFSCLLGRGTMISLRSRRL
jgi:hypothetical protein